MGVYPQFFGVGLSSGLVRIGEWVLAPAQP